MLSRDSNCWDEEIELLFLFTYTGVSGFFNSTLINYNLQSFSTVSFDFKLEELAKAIDRIINPVNNRNVWFFIYFIYYWNTDIYILCLKYKKINYLWINFFSISNNNNYEIFTFFLKIINQLINKRKYSIKFWMTI